MLLSCKIERLQVKFLNRKTYSSFLNLIIQAGLVLLPYSHFKWLPELGTTRPVSSVLFVITFGLAFISYAFKEKFHPVRTIKSFYHEHLVKLPGWQALRVWVLLIGLGTFSAMITPLYGNFFQALNRLLGYWIIFAMLYCGYYAIQAFGIRRTSWWICIGYIPVLIYAVIETLAILDFPPALSIVVFIRHWFIVDFTWAHRMALFATEPSFIAFQLLLLMAVFPFLSNKLLRISTILLVGIGILFLKKWYGYPYFRFVFGFSDYLFPETASSDPPCDRPFYSRIIVWNCICHTSGSAF